MWPNIEQRRAACEIVGWNRILAELDAKSLDKHPDPQIGELVEVSLPDAGNGGSCACSVVHCANSPFLCHVRLRPLSRHRPGPGASIRKNFSSQR